MGLVIKRMLDFCFTACVLLLLLPFLLAIGLMVWLTSPGPVFYVQERLGQYGRPFPMIKFRTMDVGSDRGSICLHQADPRITGIGRVLRRFSLDELPQLWHVLVGDMSLIGPRPTLPLIAATFTRQEQRRHSMRPGLSGWAQVQGRNSLSLRERVELDLWYVENWSLLLDLKILCRTFGVVLNGKGIYGPDGWNRGVQ